MPTARRSILALALLGVGACSKEVVEPKAACLPEEAATTVTLDVGAVQTLSGNESVGCVRIDALATQSAYVVIAANAGTGTDVAAKFRLVSSTGATSGVAASRIRSVEEVRAAITSDASSPATAIHDRLRQRERELRRLHPKAPLASRTAPGGGKVRGSIFSGTPTVGQVVTINAPGLGDDDNACRDFTARRGRVAYVSDRAVIVQDTASPTNGFTASDFQSIGTEFDNLIFRTDTTYFGDPSDADANTRIVIFYTPHVNEATEKNSSSILAGFFWAGDLFPTSDCAQSNQGEVFYLLVPDPTGEINDNVRQVSDVRERTRGTVAHEFEHMINAGVRIRRNAPDLEDVWLDEALAHFAEEMVGRAKLGATDTEELTHARIYDAANGIRDYNAFFYQNLARFSTWLSAPGDSSPTSKLADRSLAVRGAAWAFLRNAADQYTAGDVRSLTRALVAGPQSGVANFVARTGVPFDQAVSRWLVANYADNLAIPNLATTYTYRSWNMRDAVSNAVRRSYPLRVTSLTRADTETGTVRSGSGWYYDLTIPSGATSTGLSLQNGSGAAGFTNARLILLRRQ